MSLKQLWRIWDRFWFSDGSPIPVALFRIVLGLLILQFCWGISADVVPFFGPNAMVSPETSAAWFGVPKFNLFSYFPTVSIRAFFQLLVFVAACLTIGLFSRLSAFIAYLLLLSFQSQNNLAIYNILELLFLMALCLTFSRCGDALSVDRLLRIWRPDNPEFGPARQGSVVGQRLLQLQLVLIYWGAFSSKLQGQTWMDGTAIYYATHSIMFQQLQFANRHLFDQLWLCQILSWSTLVLEFMLITLIWVKELCYPVLFIGLCFHTGMELSLSIPLLQPIMVSGYITFIHPTDLTRAMSLIKRLASCVIGPPLKVKFDGTSNLGKRLAETIRRLDILSATELTEFDDSERKLESNQPLITAISPDGHHLSGAPLVRSIAWRLPLLVPASPFLWLPGSQRFLDGCSTLLRSIYRDPR